MQITPPPMPCSVAHIFVGDDSEDVFSFTQVEERDQQWLAIVKEAVEREREACAAECAGIYAAHAAAARRLEGREATHAAGQRDGANECAAAIRSRSTTDTKEPQQ